MSGPALPPADVMPGAEPFAFPGSGPNGRTGVLLVHGFTGTPMSMRPWGEHLAEAGFAVRCPLLPGHGTRWQDCNLSSHDQWTTAVDEAFDALAADCDRVFVAGLSMGGTLSIRLAEVRPDDVAGLVLVNPALLTQRLDAKLLPMIAKITGSWAPIASDIKKPGITEPANSQALLDGVSSTDVSEVVLENSYHVATLDNDAPLIFAGSTMWSSRLWNTITGAVIRPRSARVTDQS